MSRLLCCLRGRRDDMGAALSHAQEGDACDGAGLPEAPPTMADVIRERKKKAGGTGLGTLRRRIAAAARRPRDSRPDRGCEHARFIRSVVSSWRLAEVFLLCSELEAGAALRDLVTQAELAREPAQAADAALARALHERWWCDVELVGNGFSVCAHRAILASRCTYFRDLLQRYPPSVRRVPVDSVCASLSRAELEACVCALYAGNVGCGMCAKHTYKWQHGASADGDLDILNGDGAYSYRSASLCPCDTRSFSASGVARLAATLGASPDPLQQDLRYLLESGEMSDCRLSWGSYELPAHRLVLAARSRYFRSVMSRRVGGAAEGEGGVVCVDEKVLPRRFARALLHAAYTDQVDLSLIGRGSTSPSSTNSTSSSGTTWAGGGARGRVTPTAALDDVFQLYEIARFLEMPIAVQGCEDGIVEALSADSLPHILRWAAAPHASRWVHRQAMRYLRDEFLTVMASPSSVRLPRPALAAALACPHLQASEPSALRALLRWAERAARPSPPKHGAPEPNVVWHTAHSVSRRGGRRREVNDAALREVLAALVPHIRTEHLPPDHELLQQMVRRGLIPPPPNAMEGSALSSGSAADAWLGRGAYRPARCFLPHLDELKALLECQAPPEAELARMRRARYMHRIPDTLYMVSAARTSCSTSGACSAAESACVSARVRAALRARMRELRTGAPAARALALHAHDANTVLTQIALRAVREMSLPDSCADLLLNDDANEREREWESPGERRRWDHESTPPDCCRRAGSAGSQRGGGGGARPSRDGRHSLDNSRSNTCRRDPLRSAENAQHRQMVSVCTGRVPRGPRGSGPPEGPPRLSACVPDVAMAPNANTHLLSAPSAPSLSLSHAAEYSTGGILQLDLGDGATHTPRPGSRAARAMAAQHATRPRETSQVISCVRPRPDEDELRAAIEMSVIRAYSSFHPRGALEPLPAAHARCLGANTLPHPYRDLPHRIHNISRASPSPSSLSASNSGHLAHHRPLSRVSSVGGASSASSGGHSGGHSSIAGTHSSGLGAAGGHAAGAGAPGGSYSSNSSSPSASPTPRRHKRTTKPRDYRLDPSYGLPGSGDIA